MSDHPKVAIFWDYENCNPPTNSCGLGYTIVNNISRIARLFGTVTAFRTYLDISAQPLKSVTLRSELQSSGVSMIDCPHNGKKDVVDKMILVDMLAFAIDHPTPATVILITGDRDYAYAVSILKLRKYQVILVVPSSHTSPSLESQASLVIDWGAAVLRTRSETVNPTQLGRQAFLDLDANIVTKLFRELQHPPLDDPGATLRPYSTTPPNTPRLRRITTRDLLEPSKHHKNTESFHTTRDFTPTPASLRNSTSTTCDPAFGGLPIPKTPSYSRFASAASIQARSTTIVAQSPPTAIERDILTNSPPPSNAEQPSTSNIINAVCLAKHSPPISPSLVMLGLPLDGSHPALSTIVRYPFEDSQPTSDIPGSREPSISSSQKLNCLASPFVMTKTPTDVEPSLSACAITAKPTSSIACPAKMIPEAVCETLQTKEFRVSRETEHLTGLYIDANDPNFGRTTPLSDPRGRARGATDIPDSNYYSYVKPHLAGTSSSKHVLPATVLAGAGDSPQLATSPSVSNSSAPASESVPSNAFPSSSYTTTRSHEHDESGRQTWIMFEPLVHLLLAAQKEGIARPLRSTIAMDLVRSEKQVYQRAGVSRFRDYTALAEKAGIIELGGREGSAWIALHPSWPSITSTSSRVSSPMSDPPKAIQNLLSTSPETTPTERTAILQIPTLTSPKFNSAEDSYTLPISSTAQGDPIPTRFQPLIDILARKRAEGLSETLRSQVGQLLGQDIYAQASVSGFKEYIQQASETQLVQFGGVGGHAWIRLHPELRV